MIDDGILWIIFNQSITHNKVEKTIHVDHYSLCHATEGVFTRQQIIKFK